MISRLAPFVVALAACTPAREDAQPPTREQRGAYTVVWLSGSPYEIGYQHGTLLHDELGAAADALAHEPMLAIMKSVAYDKGLDEIALAVSYPEIVDECRGMVDAAGDVGWTMGDCAILNTGDMVAEFLSDGMPEHEQLAPGCLQIMARGSATSDGRPYHARILDWSKIDFILDHPTIFVREPTDGIPHVVIGFPGNISPYQGMNAEGLVVASNEVHAKDATVHDRTGRSHVQMVSRLLTSARSVADARAFVFGEDHMTLEMLGVSDRHEAEVLELAPQGVSARPLTDDLVYVTNHFTTPALTALDRDPTPAYSSIRWQRLQQLFDHDGPDSRRGALDPHELVRVLRDRVDAETGETRAPTFDDSRSIATDGALYAIVFDPERLYFWVAAGAIPVPEQQFQGFSLAELLGDADDVPAPID
jgi:hypothetical protein